MILEKVYKHSLEIAMNVVKRHVEKVLFPEYGEYSFWKVVFKNYQNDGKFAKGLGENEYKSEWNDAETNK